MNKLFPKSIEKKLEQWHKIDIKLFKIRLSMIEHCVLGMKDIGLPTNEEQADILNELLQGYDDTVKSIEEDLEVFRKHNKYYREDKFKNDLNAKQ